MAEYLNIFVKSVFIENMALAFFLGMCSFLACSKKVETALGLGLAVILVQAGTVPLNNFLYNSLLREGALSWVPFVGDNLKTVDLSFLAFITLSARSPRSCKCSRCEWTSICPHFIPLWVCSCHSSL